MIASKEKQEVFSAYAFIQHEYKTYAAFFEKGDLNIKLLQLWKICTKPPGFEQKKDYILKTEDSFYFISHTRIVTIDIFCLG